MRRAQFNLLLTAGLILTALQVQAFTVWTGGGTNDLWSNTNNWTLGAGGFPDTDVRFNAGDSAGLIDVDSTPTVKVLNFYSVATNFTISGNMLSISSESPTSTGTLINNQSPNRQTFNNDIQIISDGTYDNISTGSGGVTFNGTFSVSGADDVQAVGNVTFNHAVSCSGALRINAGQMVFSNSTANSIGSLVITSAADVTVNTAPGVNFYDGARIQHNQNNGNFTFNTANVLGDSTGININGKTSVYTFDADEDLGYLSLGAGDLTLVLGEDVVSLEFDNSAVRDWAGGSVVISNFVSNTIRFGTDTNGLTTAQLSSITAYDARTGDPVSDLAISAEGYLTGRGDYYGDTSLVVDFDRAATGNDNARAADMETNTGDTWNFSDTTALLDNSDPGATNTTIYGGMKTTWSIEQDYSPLHRYNQAVYQLRIVPGDASDTSATGMLIWKKEDFLTNSTERLAFDSGDSLSINLTSVTANPVDLRFVVKQAGSYYVSRTAKTASGAELFSIADASAEKWALLNTGDYTYGAFTSLVVDDIEAVGFYINLANTGSLISFLFDDFQVNASVVEESEPPPVDVEIGEAVIGLVPGGSSLTLAWGATNGVFYVVSNTVDLVNGPWELTTGSVVGVDGTLVITTAVDQVQNFYRIYLEQ